MTLIVLQESWIVEQTWFPTLIITTEGHLLQIAIAVNIGATLVEKVVLLDINSRVRDHTMITRLERLASALKACSDELHKYYSGLRKDVSPEMKYQLRFPRPTIMPTSTDLSLPLTVETLQSALGGPNSFSASRVQGVSAARWPQGSVFYRSGYEAVRESENHARAFRG